MTEKTFDEKMQELDERIERDLRSINGSLLKLMLRSLRNFKYTNSSGTPSV